MYNIQFATSQVHPSRRSGSSGPQVFVKRVTAGQCRNVTGGESPQTGNTKPPLVVRSHRLAVRSPRMSNHGYTHVQHHIRITRQVTKASFYVIIIIIIIIIITSHFHDPTPSWTLHSSVLETYCVTIQVLLTTPVHIRFLRREIKQQTTVTTAAATVTTVLLSDSA